MTIRDYIKMHSNETLNFYGAIVIKPYSLFGKNHYEEQEALSVLYKKLKEAGAWKPELSFYSLKDFAKKVDFNIEPEKFHVGFDSPYSYDPDIHLTLFIDDEKFIKISKSCNEM